MTPQETQDKGTFFNRAQQRQSKLKQQLALIDSMPEDAAIDIGVLCILKGRSPASIWRDVKAGRIPAPFKTGPRSTRWRLGDIRGAA